MMTHAELNTRGETDLRTGRWEDAAKAFQLAIAASDPTPNPGALAGRAKALLFSGVPATRTVAAFEAARPHVTDDWAFWSLCIRCYLTVYSECLTRLPSAAANAGTYHIAWLHREAVTDIALGLDRFQALCAGGWWAEAATAARSMAGLADWLERLQARHPTLADLQTTDMSNCRRNLLAAAKSSRIEEKLIEPDRRRFVEDVLTRPVPSPTTTTASDSSLAPNGLVGKMLLARSLDRVGRYVGFDGIAKGRNS